MGIRQLFAVSLGICLVACVTVNVYFPESAAERAADIFIKDVYGEDSSERNDSTAPAGSEPQGALDLNAAYLIAVWLRDWRNSRTQCSRATAGHQHIYPSG